MIRVPYFRVFTRHSDLPGESNQLVHQCNPAKLALMRQLSVHSQPPSGCGFPPYVRIEEKCAFFKYSLLVNGQLDLINIFLSLGKH